MLLLNLQRNCFLTVFGIPPVVGTCFLEIENDGETFLLSGLFVQSVCDVLMQHQNPLKFCDGAASFSGLMLLTYT
jgi:hypothetical protein